MLFQLKHVTFRFLVLRIYWSPMLSLALPENTVANGKKKALSRAISVNAIIFRRQSFCFADTLGHKAILFQEHETTKLLV